MIRAWQLYTGRDGHSHAVLGTIQNNHKVAAADSIHFEETPAHSALDWHTAPTTQYVITLSGTLEFVTRTGETFVIHAGEILVAMDTTGTGHKWRLIDDQPWRRAYVAFKEGADITFRADEELAEGEDYEHSRNLSRIDVERRSEGRQRSQILIHCRSSSWFDI